MDNNISEEKALAQLGIANFKDVTIDNIEGLASIFSSLDPEVAKKALELVPNFAETINAILVQYKEITSQIIASADASVSSYYRECDRIIESMQIVLNNENTSPEDRKWIIEQMILLHDKISAKDSEHKQFLREEQDKADNVFKGILLGLVGLVTTILGVALLGRGEKEDD